MNLAILYFFLSLFRILLFFTRSLLRFFLAPSSLVSAAVFPVPSSFYGWVVRLPRASGIGEASRMNRLASAQSWYGRYKGISLDILDLNLI